MGWWNKLVKDLKLTKNKDSKEPTTEEARRAVLAKEKEEATKAGKPWVGVLDTQVNPDNIKNGFLN